MKEITFQIEHLEDCEKVTVLENRIKTSASYYHKGTPDGVMIISTAADWFGFVVPEIGHEDIDE